jgi:hypothetical protein
MNQDNLPGLIDYTIDRYAGAIIDGKPQDFDAIEVQGVRAYQTGADSFAYEVDNVDPSAMSVYLRRKEGGVECCGDFTLREHAQQYAAELAALHGWPVHDYTHDPKPTESITK